MKLPTSASSGLAPAKKWPKILLWVGWLPPILLIVFILTKVTNLLIWDEWDGIAGFFLQAKAHGLSWALLWAPHNEHRLFLPRIFFYLNSLYNLSPIRLMVLSVVFFAATYEFLRRQVLSKFDPTLSREHALFAAVVPFIFFTLVQKQNYFAGFQIQWPLEALGCVLAVYGAVYRRWAWAGIGLLIAYLSLAAWASLIPVFSVLVISRWWQASAGERKALAIEAICVHFVMLALLVLYVMHLPMHQDQTHLSVLTHLFLLVSFTLQLLGGPFAFMGSLMALLFGVIFALAVLWGIKNRRFEDFTFEFYLILLAVVYSGVIAVGRAGGWNFNDDIRGRYACLVLPGWIGFLSWTMRSFGHKLRLRQFIVAFLWLCVIVTTDKGLDHELWLQSAQEQGKQYLLKALATQQKPLPHSKEAEILTGLIYPNLDQLWDRANALKNQGLFPY